MASRMINFVWVFLATFGFFALEVKAHEWTVLKTGFEHATVPVDLDGTKTKLEVFKVSPKKFHISPVWGEQKQSVKEFAQKEQALLVINANFFDTEGKALGLIQKNGRVVRANKDISWWSVFCIKEGRAAIMHQSDYKETACHSAIEAGPRLAVGGRLLRLKDENSQKTAVGIRANGDVLFVVSRGLIPIKKLAKFFVLPESQGGLGCADAMNLDGGSSSQAFAQVGGFQLEVTSFVKVPVGLGVFAK